MFPFTNPRALSDDPGTTLLFLTIWLSTHPAALFSLLHFISRITYNIHIWIAGSDVGARKPWLAVVYRRADTTLASSGDCWPSRDQWPVLHVLCGAGNHSCSAYSQQNLSLDRVTLMMRNPALLH